MVRLPKNVVVAALALRRLSCRRALSRAGAEEPAKGIALSGSVKKPQAVDAAALAALPRHAAPREGAGADGATAGRSRWKGSR